MYINKNKHIVSNFLLIATATKIIAMIGNSLSRFILMRSDYEIAMLNSNIDRVSTFIAICQLIVIAIALGYYEKQIIHIKSLIPKDEHDEIAMLQKEIAKNHISILSLEQIDHLLKLWGFILIAMQFIYELTTKVYESMITDILMLVQLSAADMGIFIKMYNGSHGFKYICMMSAIMIGVFVSGLFLDDKIMVMVSFVLLGMFMVMFMFINSSSLHMLGRDMEIVWTSVFFHILETVGILTTAIYVRFRYQGM